jgi:hypothetical protein
MEKFNSIVTEISLISIMMRFVLNMTVLFIIIRLIYYRTTKKEEYLFSFFILGIIIFLICAFLETVDIKLGMALGLFAVFSILRFRTVNYNVKDMTYTFAVIGVSVINSYANIPPPIIGAISTNLIVVLAVYLLENFLRKYGLNSMVVIYYKLELLNPKSKQDLLKDLSLQTGQNITKFTIRKIDIGKGHAEVEVYFKENMES